MLPQVTTAMVIPRQSESGWLIFYRKVSFTSNYEINLGRFISYYFFHFPGAIETNKTSSKMPAITMNHSSASGSESGSESDSSIPRKRSKNAPAEMASNRPVKRLRIDTDNSKRKFIDPR